MADNRSDALALINARLFDGTGSPVLEEAGVVVKAGRVSAVGPLRELRLPDQATVVDVAGKTVMPGMIDGHTHVTYHGGEYGLLLQQMNEPLEFNAIKAAQNAKTILETGCTAIGDGGCRGQIGVATRDAVARGVIKGPKIVSAGQMLCGSSGIQDHTAAWGYYDDTAFLGTVVNGRQEVRTAVRKQVRTGVDWVKVTASGTPGNSWIGGRTQDLNYEEISTAVEEAGKFGKKVHAHAHDPQGLREAVEAGVISLHSGEFADEEGLQLMKERGCVFMATIAWLDFRTNDDYVDKYLRAYETTPEDRKRFVDECTDAYEAARDAIVMAHKIGTPLGIGTDAAHVFPPYDIALEMEYHHRLGVPPIDVLRAATLGSATAVGREDRWGSLEPGKDADLLVVDGRPDEDVTVLRDKGRINAIMQDGRFVKDELPAPATA
ncbi:MAG: amidohydrolase family protein [Propionibacteriales bacterium]|nr:amidohydrolase family protein [Propionibacteriales bacterium]